MSQTEVQLIKDAVIVNADVSNSAAIDVSKISGAMPLAGGSFTDDVTFTGASANIVFDKSDNALEFADNAVAAFGNGSDLTITHDATNTHIRNNTGTLNLRADSVRLTDAVIGHVYLAAATGGSTDLYYDNVKKFETTANGATVTGRIETTNGLWIGSNQKYRLYDNSGVSRFDTYAYNIEFVNKGTDGSISPYLARMIPAGAVELYHNGSKKFETQSAGVEITGKLTFATEGLANGSIDLGIDADLNLYHDNSDAFIDNNTGDFYIRNAGDNPNQIYISGKGGENGIIVNGNGGVELYHDNSKKFETKSTGVKIDGGNTTNSVEIHGTGGHELYSYHDSQGVGWTTGLAGSYGELIYMNETNSRLEFYAGGENVARFTVNGSVDLYYDNSKKFETSSTGATVTGTITATQFTYASHPGSSSFTGNNSTTTFTILSGHNVNSVLVIYNGAVLTPTTDYTISGTTMTMQFTPLTNSEIVVRYLPN